MIAKKRVVLREDAHDFLLGTFIQEAAYNDLYKKHFKSAFRYGMYMLNDAFIIENIVQEAFLKLWDFRETITGIEHALRFLKQNVRWECHAYFRSPVSRFHRRFTHLDALEEYDTVFVLYEPGEEEDQLKENQLKAIKNMLPFLQAGKEKSWMKLYYADGLSHKQIALRYHVSITKVQLGLAKSINKLKAMIVRPESLFSTTIAPSDLGSRIWLYDVEGLNREQSQIYRLRTESKYDFKRIAKYLNLPQSYVQQQYVKAWKLAGLQKRDKNIDNCPSKSIPVTRFMIA